MIRLTVEQLYQLQKEIQEAGEVNATILPESAMATYRLAIAWAKGTGGATLYLSLWKNEKSWEDRIRKDNEESSFYPTLEGEYTHAYPVDEMTKSFSQAGQRLADAIARISSLREEV